jgi:hypothetical protein
MTTTPIDDNAAPDNSCALPPGNCTDEVLILREALQLVRHYPDFDDKTNLFSQVINAALDGKRHEALTKIDYLAMGLTPPKEEAVLPVIENFEQITKEHIYKFRTDLIEFLKSHPLPISSKTDFDLTDGIDISIVLDVNGTFLTVTTFTEENSSGIAVVVDNDSTVNILYDDGDEVMSGE